MTAFKFVFVVSLLAGLAACGGGGGSSDVANTPTPSSLTLTGVAATGAAISEGTVEAKCATGTGSSTTATDGTYSVVVTNGEAPCLLKATDPVTNSTYYSAAEKGASIANISPLTQLVIANALGDSPETVYQNFSATQQAKITSSSITTAVTRIQAASSALGTDTDVTGIDVMKGTLVAANGNTAGNALDMRIDALVAALASADKRISDLEAQLKSANTSNDAISKMQTVAGSAVNSLEGCAYARNGAVWSIDSLGNAPVILDMNFQAMTATSRLNGTVMPMSIKRDASNNPVKCAFTLTDTDDREVEFHISKSSTGVWKKSTDFGIGVPVQTSYELADEALLGDYAVSAFLMDKQTSERDASPLRISVSSGGAMTMYACDLTKPTPDCSQKLDSSGNSDLTCTSLSNGSASCTSPAGAQVSMVKYVIGGQPSIFMSITNMPVGNSSYKGLFIFTKTSKLMLPEVGQTRAAGSSWFVGVDSGSTTVVSGNTYAMTVESVDTASSSYVTSTSGSTTTLTRYANVPATGFTYSIGTSSKGVGMGSSAGGWSVYMAKPNSSSNYDGWYFYAKTP